MKELALAAGIALIIYMWYSTRPKGKKAPGPPKHWLPFVGNFFQMTENVEEEPLFLKLTKWANEYGKDLYELEAFGSRTFVVSSPQAAKELFEQRGSKYSSRADLPLLRDFVCEHANIGFLPYGDAWRRHRKTVHKELNVTAYGQYSHIRLREAYQLCKGFLECSPDEVVMLAERFGGSIGMGLVYDERIHNYYDPTVAEFGHVLGGKLDLLVPMASFYDFLPWFRWVPEWVMPSKKHGRIVRERGRAIDLKVSQIVEAKVDRNEDTSSLHATLLRQWKAGKSELSKFEMDSLSGTLIGASVDTSAASLLAIILALVCFPEAAAKLKAQVDSVVPQDRVPTLEDMDDIPYARAFALEAMRWRSSNRYGLPHAVSEDDVYNGVFIPKGSTVIHNAWALEHDPEMFPDDEKVIPERWLHEDGSINPDVPVYTFGVGRRVCPGQNLAMASQHFATICMAWAFDFVKAKDSNGNVIEPDSRPNNIQACGSVYRPGPFKFAVEHRHARVAELITAAVDAVN